MQKLYETDRLILKTLDSASADLVLDYYVRNRFFLEEWEPVKDGDFYTEASLASALDVDSLNMELGSSLRLWIFKKGCEDRIIGSIAFNNIVGGAFLSCFLGYKLDKNEINQGYITEAIQKGIAVMFQEYGLHRIEANIMPKNARSLRVVQKLGFYHEGLAYRYLKINGKWEDHIHMVLLNDAV